MFNLPITWESLLGRESRSQSEASSANADFDSKRAAVAKLDGLGDSLVTVAKVHNRGAVLSVNRRASYNGSRTYFGGVAERLKVAVLKN